MAYEREKFGQQLVSDGPSRRTVASEVVEELEKLAAYAEELSRNVSTRLEPITSRREPDANKPPRDDKVGMRPPLFDVLSSHIRTTHNALDEIRAILNRVEL